jgi:hypothetical protein
MSEIAWSQRFLDTYKVDVRTDQGTSYRLVAHRKGFPIHEPYWRLFVPSILNIVWEFLRELKFRVRDHRHWVIDIYTIDEPDDAVLSRCIEVPSRQEAFDRIKSEAEALRPGHEI